jgi:hypothetical protein
LAAEEAPFTKKSAPLIRMPNPTKRSKMVRNIEFRELSSFKYNAILINPKQLPGLLHDQ